jgi:hypothetical protein
MSDDLMKIKDWIKKQETDEPIPIKSKDRVYTDLARSIKHTAPLPKGTCHLCGKDEDRLVPLIMKVCPACALKFMKKGGPMRIFRKEIVEYACDYCMGKTFVVYTLNPNICEKCSNLIGKRHKYDR